VRTKHALGGALEEVQRKLGDVPAGRYRYRLEPFERRS
jgi:hypothetical protein